MTSPPATARPPRLSVGVNPADPLHLGRDLDSLAEAGVTLFHIDVMDGVFCPAMTVGPAFVTAVAGAGFPVDVHLMIDEPLPKVSAYADAGAQRITFHVEADRHPHRVLHELAGRGILRGVALCPGTPVQTVEPLLGDLESVLVLSVDPGWSGAAFSPGTPSRVQAVRELIAGRPIEVGVDGAITRENLLEVAALGPDLIVSGSAVFADGHPARNARFMLDALAGAGP